MMPKLRNKSYGSDYFLEDMFEQNLIEYKKIADKLFRSLNAAIDPIGAKLIILLEGLPNKTKDEKRKIASIKSKFNSSGI